MALSVQSPTSVHARPTETMENEEILNKDRPFFVMHVDGDSNVCVTFWVRDNIKLDSMYYGHPVTIMNLLNQMNTKNGFKKSFVRHFQLNDEWFDLGNVPPPTIQRVYGLALDDLFVNRVDYKFKCKKFVPDHYHSRVIDMRLISDRKAKELHFIFESHQKSMSYADLSYIEYALRPVLWAEGIDMNEICSLSVPVVESKRTLIPVRTGLYIAHYDTFVIPKYATVTQYRLVVHRKSKRLTRNSLETETFTSLTEEPRRKKIKNEK